VFVTQNGACKFTAQPKRRGFTERRSGAPLDALLC